jgi:hypothetical protein
MYHSQIILQHSHKAHACCTLENAIGVLMDDLVGFPRHGHVICPSYSKVAMKLLGALSPGISVFDTMMTVCELS